MLDVDVLQKFEGSKKALTSKYTFLKQGFSLCNVTNHNWLASSKDVYNIFVYIISFHAKIQR